MWRWRGGPPLLLSALVLAGFELWNGWGPAPAPPPPPGAELACGLVEIVDGDTIEARCPAGLLTVRLWGIDAPELGQAPWGERAREGLSALLAGAELALRVAEQDRYGRTVARVYAGGLDAGLELVRRGHAVVYRRYNDSARYRLVERRARERSAGIWSRPGPQQRPERWRRFNPRST